MNKKLNDYLNQMQSYQQIGEPRTTLLIARLTMGFLLCVALLMMFIPWIQTASGPGVVSTQNATDRMQEIHALVSGQIRQWHVVEGQQVKAGDPIVTLVDTDQNLLIRLEAEKTAIQQQLNANRSALKTAELDLTRRQQLHKDGLVSKRDVEQAKIRLEDMRAKIATTEASLQRIQVNLARQSTQTKYAPHDGTIVRLRSGAQATMVRAGDTLATFIPANVKRSVVMEVSGMDAPLVHPGRKVRLQFDGWPVLQFSGWPSKAVGTFGGVVKSVEPVSTQQGTFRVWVEEDPKDEPWPGPHYVRLGSHARGWILLEEVRLGYEIWRQMNNFPPEYTGNIHPQ